MKLTFLVLIAAVAVSSLAHAAPPPPAPPSGAAEAPKPPAKPRPGDAAKAAKLSPEDQQIVAHLHELNLMEIELGKLAQKRGGEGGKRLGGMLVREHQTMDKELTALAKKRGLTKIPMEQPTTEAEKREHQDMKDAQARLAKLTAAEFDRNFLAIVVMGHDQEIARAERAIATTSDADLKAHLQRVQPMLQRHADTARQLQQPDAQASAPPAKPKPSAAAK